MKINEVIFQLNDLIEDRKSFISDDKESNEIYLKDIQALQTAIRFLTLFQEECEKVGEKNND